MFIELVSAAVFALATHMSDKITNASSSLTVGVIRNIRNAFVTAAEYLRLSSVTFPEKEKQLEAHPILTNLDILQFNVRSKNIFWDHLISPLSLRAEPRQLGEMFQEMIFPSNIRKVDRYKRRKVLVCHDMMGNYRDDRYYHGSNKWDDYKFYHWAGIDYFCYFSHEYVTIPPAGWINAAHMHGVRVLGTYITENRDGEIKLHEVLQSFEMAGKIAIALVHLAEHFNFDGWLINIECKVEPNKIPVLKYFLRILTQKMHESTVDGIVIWYDSVIENGFVSWQNELNEKNVDFFKMCDGILINYSWNDANLQNTKATIESINSELMNRVFIGIDVFGRNQVAKFNTNETLKRIVDYDFSVGIFAPGWTFESLTDQKLNISLSQGHDLVNSTFLQRNDRFWNMLWEWFLTHPIATLPFYTYFCLGSGKYSFEYGWIKKSKFFNLRRQVIQPSIPLLNYIERCFEHGINGGSSLKILQPNKPIRLFATDFIIDRVLIFGYASKTIGSDCQIDCILHVTNWMNTRQCRLVCGHYEEHFRKGCIYLKPYSDTTNIMKFLEYERHPLRLPFSLSNGWNVRYYMVQFNSPINIIDIGVQFSTHASHASEKSQEGYLGAIYINGGKSNILNVPIISENVYFV